MEFVVQCARAQENKFATLSSATILNDVAVSLPIDDHPHGTHWKYSETSFPVELV
jgi:hypothetical protein